MSSPTAGEPSFRMSVSELTTMRWELAEEIERISAHRFEAIAIWRTKLSDVGVAGARRMLRRAGMGVSSLQWAGGFTGSDGRTFRESVEDAREAILAASALGCGVVVIQPGCRGGHTLGHAHRLLCEAMEILVPEASDRGVTLAIQPSHAGSPSGCGFLTRVASALEWVDRFDHPGVALALDLWQFAGDAALPSLLSDLVRRLAVVKVADRVGPPSAGVDRLLPGRGTLPLESLVAALTALGYRGWIEFEIVGEATDGTGYDGTLRQVREVADRWSGRHQAPPAQRGHRWADAPSTR